MSETNENIRFLFLNHTKLKQPILFDKMGIKIRKLTVDEISEIFASYLEFFSVKLQKKFAIYLEKIELPNSENFKALVAIEIDKQLDFYRTKGKQLDEDSIKRIVNAAYEKHSVIFGKQLDEFKKRQDRQEASWETIKDYYGVYLTKKN